MMQFGLLSEESSFETEVPVFSFESEFVGMFLCVHCGVIAATWYQCFVMVLALMAMCGKANVALVHV